jgi:hypothetical protein
MANKPYLNKVKPFIEIFDGKIKLITTNSDPRKEGIIWNREYNCRIVEARKYKGESDPSGTIISRVSKEIYGSVSNTKLIQYLGPTLDNFLHEHAVVTDIVKFPYNPHSLINGDHLPLLFQKGKDVPRSWDEECFNIDEIWPEQRFVAMDPTIPIKQLYDNSQYELLSDQWWKGVWVGLVWGPTADIIGGAHTAWGSIVNVGDLMEHKLDRFAGLAVHGRKLGLGLGVQWSLQIVVLWGYNQDDIISETPFAFKMKNFDLQAALGLAVPLNLFTKQDIITGIFSVLKSLKMYSRYTNTGNAGDRLKSYISSILRNIQGNSDGDFPKRAELFVTIPVAAVSSGMHFFIGWKSTTVETFKETHFGKKADEIFPGFL